MNPVDRKGVAMLTALGILVILGLLGSVFVAHMKLETAYAGRDAQQLKSQYLARAGVGDAIARLHQDSPAVDAYTDAWWTGSSPKMVSLGEGGYTIRITDEAARINVLDASPQAIGALVGGDKEAVASILNFRSSRKLYAVNDFIAADLKADVFSRLSSLGTVLDTRKININTAGADVIAALPGMDTETAQMIVEFRRGPDAIEGTPDDFVFAAPGDIVKVPGLTPLRTAPAASLLKVNSDLFRVESVGSVLRGKRKISNSKVTAVINRNPKGRIHIVSWENS
jgi:type II secretory pathway component PulK